jgi:hypothetical protein
MNMKTEVVCIRGHQDDPDIDDVIYVGRPVYSGGWNLSGHPLANPFKVSQLTTPAQAVAQYDRWLDTQTELLEYWLPRLKGRRLGCWCAQGEPCHARVLAFRADAYVMKAYKILVTASRHLKDRRPVHAGLEQTVAQVPEEQPVIVMQGGAKGGDLFADEWAEARRPRIKSRTYPADWNRFGNRAGRLRNEEMVARRPDVCLAIILACVSPKCDRVEPHGSHGAVHCADIAEADRIPTFRYEPWKN